MNTATVDPYTNTYDDSYLTASYRDETYYCREFASRHQTGRDFTEMPPKPKFTLAEMNRMASHNDKLVSPEPSVVYTDHDFTETTFAISPALDQHCNNPVYQVTITQKLIEFDERFEEVENPTYLTAHLTVDLRDLLFT